MSSVREEIEREIDEEAMLPCPHGLDHRWECARCTREMLTRIARLAASEAVRYSNSEYEIFRDGVPGRLIELTVAAVLGEEVGT